VSAVASDVFVVPLLHILAFHVWTVAAGKCGERLRVSVETSTANTGQEAMGVFRMFCLAGDIVPISCFPPKQSPE
jgi:hypothetical protein